MTTMLQLLLSRYSFSTLPRRLCTAATVNKNELGNFAKLSQQWWDRNGPFKALHSMNFLRVPWIKNAIVSSFKPGDGGLLFPLRNVNILEIGCGGGLLSERLARLGANVYAVDAENSCIEVAKEHLKNSDLGSAPRYSVGNVDNVKSCFDLQSYDVLVASEVLEHVNEWSHFVRQCVELVRPGGLLFYTTINKTLYSHFFAIFLAENVFRIVPKGVHDWHKFVPPEDLQFVLEKHGCWVRSIYGMGYNLFTDQWSWVDQKCINYALYAQKHA